MLFEPSLVFGVGAVKGEIAAKGGLSEPTSSIPILEGSNKVQSRVLSDDGLHFLNGQKSPSHTV